MTQNLRYRVERSRSAHKGVQYNGDDTFGYFVVCTECRSYGILV